MPDFPTKTEFQMHDMHVNPVHGSCCHPQTRSPTRITDLTVSCNCSKEMCSQTGFFFFSNFTTNDLLLFFQLVENPFSVVRDFKNSGEHTGALNCRPIRLLPLFGKKKKQRLSTTLNWLHISLHMAFCQINNLAFVSLCHLSTCLTGFR